MNIQTAQYHMHPSMPVSHGMQPDSHDQQHLLTQRHLYSPTSAENLLKRSILQADKGVKCPYCRQFILGFELTGTTG